MCSSHVRFIPAPWLHRKTKPRKRLHGFTLVEVVLAIGVVAFAFVGLLALMPVGLSNFRKAMDASVGSEIGQRVFNDIQQTDFDTLLKQASITVPTSLPQPVGTMAQVAHGSLPHRFFDDQGNEVILPSSGSTTTTEPTSADRSKYRILYDVHSEVILKPQIPSGTNEVIQSPNLANIIVQVINNPAGVTLPELVSSRLGDSDPNTGVYQANVTFAEYSGFISRNGKSNASSSSTGS